MIRLRKNNGITIVALVITIIVLLILSGVTISMIVGENGIISKATKAKNDTIVAREKEAIAIAWSSLIEDNILHRTEITADAFRKELYSNGEDTIVSNEDGGNYLVHFNDSGNEYIVDNDGNIKEKNNSNNPEDDVVLGMDDYVQDDSLILWYDGIKNTRSGNNPNATSWEDLSGNNNDGVFSSAMVANQDDITSSSKGYYSTEEQGYVFLHNDAYIDSLKNVGLSGDAQYTVEVVMTPWNVGKVPAFPSGYSYSAPIWFGTYNETVSSSMVHAYRYSDNKMAYWFVNNGGDSDSGSNITNKKTYISFTKSYTGQVTSGTKNYFNITVNGAKYATEYKGNSRTMNLVDSPAHLGREWQWGGQNRTMYGVIHSIRVYNRPLTEEEINKNYLVDNDRFLKEMVVLDKENKKIKIDTTDISSVKYVIGKESDIDTIKNNGRSVSINGNKPSIDITENNIYSILITDKSGSEYIKDIKAEGFDLTTNYKINNENLSYKRIVTVGTGEECSTVKQAFDYLCDQGYTDNVAILLKEGTHDTRELHQGTSYNILPKYNGMKVSIIADKPGKTFMTAGEMVQSENNSSYSMELNFYRIVFVSPIYGHGFSLEGDSEKNSYYNCVFVPAVGGWNGNYNSAEIGTYNCLFLGGSNEYYARNPLNGESINSASVDTVIDPCSGTKTTCLTNVTVDSDYNITSDGWENSGTGENPDGSKANIGVYGGKYSW